MDFGREKLSSDFFIRMKKNEILSIRNFVRKNDIEMSSVRKCRILIGIGSNITWVKDLKTQ